MPEPDPTTTRRISGGGPSWGAAPAHPDLIGRTLGDFRVERLLGSGGMGEVYLARQVSLDRPVAFKVLRPEMLTHPTAVSRLEAEAGAAAKINHPNIVHVYQLGTVEGLRYIAMEYVAGTTLKEYIARKGGLELATALSIMKQAGQAVGAAGEIGLVHRDIKPENLLLTRKGQVKVADFGLCRFQGPDAVHLTGQGITLGTPLYMSPEQVQGREVDHRSDLYSLGVTFYTLLAGRPPFDGDTALAVALKHVHERPTNLAVHRPELPPELVALVMRLMAKAPADRYESAAEMLKDLAQIRLATAGAASIGTTVPAPAEAAATTSPVPTEPEEAAPAGRPAGRLSPARVVGLLALSAAVGGGLGWRARPADLIAATAPPPGPLGLWLAPGWKDVPRQPTAEAQFRHAQLLAPADEQDAAWMAVPTYFPTERRWAFPAYVHFARDLFRGQDEGRLRALAADLERSDHPRDVELARVARAAASALRDDAELLGEFSLMNPTAMEPAVLQFALEIVSRRRIAEADGPVANRLRKLRADLLSALQVDFEPPGLARPR